MPLFGGFWGTVIIDLETTVTSGICIGKMVKIIPDKIVASCGKVVRDFSPIEKKIPENVTEISRNICRKVG
jgi:predicted ThiF/HesA family dinucleotide-utilizing enzyme